MNEVDEIWIEVDGKKIRKLKGRKAQIALKAIEIVLAGIPKKIKIDIIDATQEDFSYSKALLEALDQGIENPIEIAEYIFKKRARRISQRKK
jgi:hypothetical protein